MYHSMDIIRMDNATLQKNTWEDWYLIPSSRPTFSMPKLKSRTIDIPGRDGVLDFSDSYGTAVFENREGSFEFIVENDHVEWQRLYSDIANFVHGRKVRIVLEDDPGYYYEGRVTVNEWRSDPQYSLVVLDYSVGPYKYARWSAMDDWLWDPLDFVGGVIREYKDVQVITEGGKTIVRKTFESSENIDPSLRSYDVDRDELLIVGSRLFGPLEISYTDADDLGIDIYELGPVRDEEYATEALEDEYRANKAKHVWSTGTDGELSGNDTLLVPDFFFEDKEYALCFSGDGCISVSYREGSL